MSESKLDIFANGNSDSHEVEMKFYVLRTKQINI